MFNMHKWLKIKGFDRRDWWRDWGVGDGVTSAVVQELTPTKNHNHPHIMTECSQVEKMNIENNPFFQVGFVGVLNVKKFMLDKF